MGSGSADRAALWTVLVFLSMVTAMLLEWVWDAGWRWEVSTLISGVAVTCAPLIVAGLLESHRAIRSAAVSEVWSTEAPWARQTVRPGAADGVAEPVTGPEGAGSASAPEPPTVNFVGVAPPPPYFNPMAPNPNVDPPTARFPSVPPAGS